MVLDSLLFVIKMHVLFRLVFSIPKMCSNLWAISANQRNKYLEQFPKYCIIYYLSKVGALWSNHMNFHFRHVICWKLYPKLHVLTIKSHISLIIIAMLFQFFFFLYYGIFPLLDDILFLVDEYFHAKAFDNIPERTSCWIFSNSSIVKFLILQSFEEIYN